MNQNEAPKEARWATRPATCRCPISILFLVALGARQRGMRPAGPRTLGHATAPAGRKVRSNTAPLSHFGNFHTLGLPRIGQGKCHE